MDQFKNLKQQLLREYGIKVHDITEESNYSPSYIGPKRYTIRYEDPIKPENGTIRELLPSEICDDLWRNVIDWSTVCAIVTFIVPLKNEQQTEPVAYRATSSKCRTRKELNKIKVKGYYENM